MRDHPVLRLGFRLRRAALPAACAILPQLFGCSDEGAPHHAALPGAAAPYGTSPEAHARVAAIRARFAGVLGPSAIDAVAPTTAGAFRVIAGRAATATVELPGDAAGAVRLVDEASGLEVSVTMVGARPAPLALADGLALFQGAGPHGADVMIRVHGGGIEDYVLFEREPVQKEVRYRLEVGGIAGLRLIEGALELLDEAGVPRLRVAPPYLVDAAGKSVPAALALEGCAADRSPRAPFGRQVTPPGAPTCDLSVSWEGAAVRYPALVDPSWSSTKNSMARARTQHTATVLDPADPASLVLIAGGFDENDAALPNAELYEPLNRVFALTSSMLAARGAHTATALTTVPPTPQPFAPPVLIAGGANAVNGTPIASIEVYDAAHGVFVSDPNPIPPDPIIPMQKRFNHTATLIADRKVLLAGGLAPPLTQATDTAYLYTLTSFDGGNPVSTLAATADTLTTARHTHAAVRLMTGDVLITGGFVQSGGALTSAELYNVANDRFDNITASAGFNTQMTVLRGAHTATLLDTPTLPQALIGEVLIAGGVSNNAISGVFSNTVDIYHDGVQVPTKRGFEIQPTPITMQAARASHSATLLPTGLVVVAGGLNSGGTLDSAEMFRPATATFSPLVIPAGSKLLIARRNHTAVLVNAGSGSGAGRAVLVTGGSDVGPLDSAQTLLKSLGEPCALGQECASGDCAEGVCCDKGCTEQCYSCTAAGKGSGGNGTCGPAKSGTLLPVICIEEIEVHNECNGAGVAIPNSDTKDCKPGTCGLDNRCITYCGCDADCSKTGWCNKHPGAGGGGSGGEGGSGGGSCIGAGGGVTDLDAGPPPGAGLCQDRLANGAQCNRPRQCDSDSDLGNCVDGSCCNLPCLGSCQACNVKDFIGQCTPIGTEEKHEQPSDPGGLLVREPCLGTEEGACHGYCGGNLNGTCKTPPVGKVARAPECTCPDDGCLVGPATLTSFECDGAGNEVAQQPVRCVGFRCDSKSACKDSCTSDADCIQDFICQDDRCADLNTTGSSCDGERTLRKVGADQDCSPYRCPLGGNACPTSCKSVADCVSVADVPYACNGAGKCVPPLGAPTVASCSCRVPGRADGGDDSPSPLLFTALAAAVRRRRRAPTV